MKEGISRMEQMANLPFEIWKYFIVGEQSAFSAVWAFFDIICCISSSYLYAYIAAFGMKDFGYTKKDPIGHDQEEFFISVEITFEIIFMLSIIKQFLTEYTPEGETIPVRDLQKIAKRYIKDGFLLDFICVLPISRMLKFMGEEARLFYLIKSIRIHKGIRIFSVPAMMKGIKNFNAYRLDNMIKKNLEVGNDKNNDRIKINMLMMISYTLRILKLVIILFNLSYFFGIAWYIYCNLVNKIITHQIWEELATGEHPKEEEEYFISVYGMDTFHNGHQAIIVMYFAFTSLSTVGLGDFHPVNQSERLLCAFLLLFGVSIQSYIMGIFIQILEEFKQMNEGLDEGEALSKFFLVLNMYNNAKPINQKFRDSIQAHMDYRWDNDKSVALHTEEAQSIFPQLPEHTQNKIYVSFLYNEFLQKFYSTFKVLKKVTEDQIQTHYTWDDDVYRLFMIRLLNFLEPRKTKGHTIIIDELQEVIEAFFVSKGTVLVGYDINKMKRYCMRFQEKCLIGAYEMTYGQRAQFIYTALTSVSGYTIRKQNWKKLLDQEEGEIVKKFKQNIIFSHMRINAKVHLKRKQAMQKIVQRSDYNMLQVSKLKSVMHDIGLIKD